MIQRGKFIVLQGLDRSGKSSVTSFLSKWLVEKNHPTQSMGFPDRTTPVGKMINEFLSNKAQLCQQAVHLLFSANRWENMSKISKVLESGTSIVCDRYWYSGVAYSMAKGMNGDWCSWPDKGLIQPDLVIYLKADPEVLSKRAQYGQQRFQKLEFQSKVKQSFERLFKELGDDRVHTIEVGSMGLEEVQETVKKQVQKIL